MKHIDILCVGEVLIDFIGHQKNVMINDTKDFHRYLGGSPTNVAMNSVRLGLSSMLVATVGNDSFGDYIFSRLEQVGVDSDNVRRVDNFPTTIIFVSRTESTPDFLQYREADMHILENQINGEILKNASIFHTTCFALSENPAQSTILKKAEEAYQNNCQLSIDVNYSEKIWKNRLEAIRVIKSYCQFNPLVKISQDDMSRLFGAEYNHDQVFDFFHQNGVDIICLTMGEKGVKLSQKNKELIQLSAEKIDKIVDATGAGDAFWSGFLFAYLQKKSLKECLKIALKLSSLKLQNVGRLPDRIIISDELI